MSVSPSDHSKGTDSQPPRMPLRWVIILAVSTIVGFVLSARSNAAVAVSTAIALAMLLSVMLE